MSDIAMTVDVTTKSKAPKNVTSPSTAFEPPKFEMPNFEMPEAMRELVEKGRTQAKENYKKLKSATEEMTAVVEATYANSAKGATDYGLKVIEMIGANTNTAFDLIGKLMTVKSPSEAAELSTAHARQQFDAISAHNKELLALAQKVATDAVEPIKTGMAKAFERKP